MNKLLIICGPTATGKTALGVRLAKKFDGEIISADSRQVYKYMDIGTGKDLPLPVPIWGVDLVKPDQEFSVAHWIKFAQKTIKDIWKRKKLPIIVGGTGFWIKALIDGVDSIGIAPDWELRKKLDKLSLKELQSLLQKTCPKRIQGMNQSDRNNPRRLIRAIEIAKRQNNQQSAISNQQLTINSLLIIGLKANNKFLYQRIDKRVEKRIKQGAQKEVKDLIKKGYSWDLISMSGLGYQQWKPFFEKKTSLEKVIQRWQYDEHGYSRRQMTFLKKLFQPELAKGKKIKWFDIEKKNYQIKVEKLVKSWYY